MFFEKLFILDSFEQHYFWQSEVAAQTYHNFMMNKL
jgi:hypothetical protein